MTCQCPLQRDDLGCYDCLFSVRDEPYLLSLTFRGANPKFFRFDVKQGYIVDNYLGDKYHDLRDVLFVDGRANERLIPSVFLDQLNQAMPRTAYARSVPPSEVIVRLREDIEEPDKPYFDRWQTRGTGPSKRNKQKTLVLFGKEALDHSVHVNMSSIWSAQRTSRNWR